MRKSPRTIYLMRIVEMAMRSGIERRLRDFHLTDFQYTVLSILKTRDGLSSADLSRRFRNGVTIGVYATKTNVSSAEFGEGSFDKGVYVTFPFDIMLTRSSDQWGTVLWQPLLRDGGAKLNRAYPLYDLTRMSDPRSLWYGPPGVGR